MHVVLGLLTAIVTILYLLDRMGIDLGGLNPFYWRRRRAWAKKYEGDPIYSVEDPVQVAAVMVVGVAQLDGDLSAEQKEAARREFEAAFSLDEREASRLLNSATHLLGAQQVIDTQLKGLLSRHKERFTHEQVESLLKMMEAVASADGALSTEQSDYLSDVRCQFAAKPAGEGTWSQ